jgi:tRNA threonylcarbamoyladenosine biosynthesis protein TsaE
MKAEREKRRVKAGTSSFTLMSRSAAQTRSLGKKLGSLLAGGELIGLAGELGSGKTCFVRGLAKGLNVDENTWLRSPTFTLINEYKGRVPIYHIDLYRVSDPAALATLELAEYLESDGVAVIEWFDYLPREEAPEHLRILFEHAGRSERKLTFTAQGESYLPIVEQLQKTIGSVSELNRKSKI